MRQKKTEVRAYVRRFSSISGEQRGSLSLLNIFWRYLCFQIPEKSGKRPQQREVVLTDDLELSPVAAGGEIGCVQPVKHRGGSLAPGPFFLKLHLQNSHLLT